MMELWDAAANGIREFHTYSGLLCHIGQPLFSRDDGGVFCSVEENPDSGVMILPQSAGPSLLTLLQLCEHSPQTEEAWLLLWPDQVLFDEEEAPRGYLVARRPRLSGEPKRLYSSDAHKKPESEYGEILLKWKIGGKLAEIFQEMHAVLRGQRQYLFGMVRTSDFLVDAVGNVLYIGVDRCGIPVEPDPSELCPAPELLCGSNPYAFTAQSDDFLLAQLLFRLLTDCHPFDVGGRSDTETGIERLYANVCDGKSAFFDETSAKYEQIRLCLSQYPDVVERYFRRAFDYCGHSSYTGERPSAEDWRTVFTQVH